MPEALISSTTSPGPGVGSGKSRISTLRSPARTTPFMRTSLFAAGSQVEYRGSSRSRLRHLAGAVLRLLRGLAHGRSVDAPVDGRGELESAEGEQPDSGEAQQHGSVRLALERA